MTETERTILVNQCAILTGLIPVLMKTCGPSASPIVDELMRQIERTKIVIVADGAEGALKP